jgi:hypothetical protein
MRPDMAKVIVERPRHGSSMRGHGKGYHKKLQRFSLDEMPKRERIKPCGNTKHLNEHLRPLQRYIRKQIGRPWDKVFSEICKHISRNNAVQDHVRDHVGDFVAVKVIEIDGVLHEVLHWGGVVPLHTGWRYPMCYVCPKTGLLKNLGKISRRTPGPEALPQIQVSVDCNTTFIRRDGVWLRLTLEQFPKQVYSHFHNVPFTVFDAFKQVRITRADAVSTYGRAMIAKEVRVATPAEIRKYCEPLKAPNRV